MEETLAALHRFLQIRPGFEAVLVAPTMSMGRQLLAASAARFGGVLGVQVHTPDTLAREQCGTDCPSILSRDAGAMLVLSLLRENGASWPYFSSLGADRITLSAARALLEDILLLEQEGRALPAGQETPRLAGLSVLLAAYQEEKTRRSLWDRYDLFACAADRLKEKPLTVPAAICANVTGEGIVQEFLKEIKADVLPVPCSWEVPPAPALFLPQTVHAPAACLRFVKGCGQENEALFPFYDLLERQIPFGQAALLCAKPEDLLLLREQAARLGVPLTLEGGVPLEKGTLLPLLRALVLWYGSGCPLEGLPGLMAGGLVVPHGAAFLKYLRERHVGGQLSRYLSCLERTQRDSPAEQLLERCGDWIAFCGAIQALFDEDTRVEEGLALLRPFLQEWYVKRLPQARAPECAALLSALENMAGNAPGGSFFALLPELLDAAGRTPWQSAAPRDGAVHAAPLSKGAFLDRPYTYVLGLGRDALTAPGRGSPLLRDEERAALGVPSSNSGAELPVYYLGTVLAAAKGEVTLSYSCFDTEKILAMHPSPVYKKLRETAGPVLFGYHRPVSLTGADRWLKGHGRTAPTIPTVEKTEMPEDFVFSASSLELAMKCPRQFYFQYMLKVPQVEKTGLSKRSWLPNGRDLAILDYKTGRIGTFFRESDSKLQYYLYTKAAEQLGFGQLEQAISFWFDEHSPLRRLTGAGTCYCELPFHLVLSREDENWQFLRDRLDCREDFAGSISVSGILDLAILTEEGWYIVDYKTDQLRPGEGDEAYRRRLAGEYEAQLNACTRILSKLSGKAVLDARLCAIPLWGQWVSLSFASPG